MEKILYLQPLAKEVLDGIQKYVPKGMALDALATGDASEITEKIKDVKYAIVATTKIDRQLLSQAPHLRLVQHQGVGYDIVNMQDMRDVHVTLALNTAGLSAVSEHAILLILATYRRLNIADRAMRNGEWLQYELRAESRQLANKRVGLIGLGRIGQSTAAKLAGFNVDICYYDKFRQSKEVEEKLAVTYLPYEELLATSDIVCLHLGLNNETRHMMGKAQFAMMKQGAILINTARGGLVDEEALIEALKSNKLSGAGLDVFNVEPIGNDNALLSMPNVVLTPHISAGTKEVLDEKMIFAFNNIARFEQGLPVDCIVA